MKFFSDSKTDTSQDAEIKKIWQWIGVLNKNQKVLIQNNDYFIKAIQQLLAKDKELIETVNALVETDKRHDLKDKEHDARDVEHDKLLEGLKNLTKQIESTAT